MSEKTLPFRWTYIILPIVILLISIFLTAFFYRLLPAEVVYSFQPDSPDNYATRGAVIAWTLTPQLFFVLFAAAIVWGVIKLSSRFRQLDNTRTFPKKVLSLMGNMLALPQLILAFVMLDIFVYHAYQTHLMPLWIFALIVMALGGFYLGIFFIQALRQVGESSRTAAGRGLKEQQ